MNSIIEIENISYEIKDKRILKNINMTINKGEHFALIGINGSGKSTLISLILSDILPSEGEIRIKGRSPRKFTEWGVLYDFPCLYSELTVDETIKMFSSLNNVKYQTAVDKYYTIFEINFIKKSLISELSAGEKRRVSILLSILRPVDLLIMDEPFSNLDPIMVEKMWSVIKEDNRTILFSSHDWAGVELMASKIAFIYKGEIIGKPLSVEETLKNLPSSKIVTFSEEFMVDELTAFEHYKTGNNISLFYDKEIDKTDIFSMLNNKNISFNVRKVDIRDAYLYNVLK